MNEVSITKRRSVLRVDVPVAQVLVVEGHALRGGRELHAQQVAKIVRKSIDARGEK